jgi:secreted trypsin-like serine protease
MAPRPSSILVALLTVVLTVATVGVAGNPTPADAARRPDRRVNAELLGSSDVPDGTYAFLVAVGTIGETGGFGRLYCGGSLIAPAYVLTAAHCMRGESPETVAVIVGPTVLGTDQGEPRRVTAIAVHPEYDSRTGKNDVAVLTLDEPVTTISPVPVVAADDTSFEPAGTSLTIAGWGATKRRNGRFKNYPLRLRQATVTVIADAQCAKQWRVTKKQYIFDPITLCTSARHAPGDSGGPVFTVANGAYLQISVMTSAYGHPGKHKVADFGPQLSAPGIRSFITSIAGV